MCVAFVAGAAAQEWPTQPVHIVHAGGAGGGTDAMARLLGDALAKRLNTPVVIEAKPGAGTIVAAQAVTTAAPDGYRLFMSSVSTMAATPWLYAKLPYDVTTSFESIARLTLAPNALVASNTLPVKDMNELIAYGRANPGKLNLGSIGQGTTSHLVGVAVARATGMEVANVPYKSTAELTLALSRGDIQIAAQDLGGILGQIKGGAMRPLAVTGDERHPELPDVPTMKELGIPSANLSVWFGLEAPAGTSPAVIERLAKAVADVMKDPEVIERYQRLGVRTAFMPTQEYTAFRLDELKRYEAIVAATGLEKR